MKLYCSQHIKMTATLESKGLVFEPGYVFEVFMSKSAFRFYSSSEDLDTFSGLKTIYEVETKDLDIVVCEGALEQASMEQFKNSALPLKDYKLGKFIKPIYFCFSEVPAEKLKVFHEEDNLKLFESNDKFYIECLFQKMKEKYPNFDLYAVRSCLEALASAGKFKRTENGNFIIFEDVVTGEIIPVCKKYTN